MGAACEIARFKLSQTHIHQLHILTGSKLRYLTQLPKISNPSTGKSAFTTTPQTIRYGLIARALPRGKKTAPARVIPISQNLDPLFREH